MTYWSEMLAKPLRITFATCHEFGTATVRGLVASDHFRSGRISLHSLITAERDVAGPIVGERFSSVDDLSHLFARHRITNDLRLSNLGDFLVTGQAPDIVLIIGWPRLIKSETILGLRRTSPTTLVLGMHPSLLPHGRGQSPVSWTILEGLRNTGVTVFDLESLPDSGPIRYVHSFDVRPNETAASLCATLLIAHQKAALGVVSQQLRGELALHDQDENMAVFWRNPGEPDRLIDRSMTPTLIKKRVRAFGPPYAGATAPDGSKALLVSKRVVPEQGLQTRHGRSRWLTLSDTTVIRLVDDTTYAAIVRRTARMDGSVLDPVLQVREPDREVQRHYSGVVLVNQAGNVMLQRRDENPTIVNPGFITLFGGLRDDGESSEECAVRETFEELGIHLEIDQLRRLGYADKIEADGSLTRCAIFLANGIDDSIAEIAEGKRVELGTFSEFLGHPDLSNICRLAVASGSEA